MAEDILSPRSFFLFTNEEPELRAWVTYSKPPAVNAETRIWTLTRVNPKLYFLLGDTFQLQGIT